MTVWLVIKRADIGTEVEVNVYETSAGAYEAAASEIDAQICEDAPGEDVDPIRRMLLDNPDHVSPAIRAWNKRHGVPFTLTVEDREVLL